MSDDNIAPDGAAGGGGAPPARQRRQSWVQRFAEVQERPRRMSIRSFYWVK